MKAYKSKEEEYVKLVKNESLKPSGSSSEPQGSIIIPAIEISVLNNILTLFRIFSAIFSAMFLIFSLSFVFGFSVLHFIPYFDFFYYLACVIFEYIPDFILNYFSTGLVLTIIISIIQLRSYIRKIKSCYTFCKKIMYILKKGNWVIIIFTYILLCIVLLTVFSGSFDQGFVLCDVPRAWELYF